MVNGNKKIYCNGLMNIKKYIKIYSLFLYTSLASELEYKTNIIIDFITAILSLIGSIFLLSIFFLEHDLEYCEAIYVQKISPVHYLLCC